MHRFRLAAVAAFAVAALATPATAQTFGQLTGARTLPVNGHEFGAYVELSENLFALMGQLRMSFYPDVDFGFQGGLGRYDLGGSDITTARLGADFKYLAASVGRGATMDLALGAAIGMEAGDDFSVLTLGPNLVVSRSLYVAGSERLVPYASLGMFITNVDVGPTSTNDFSAPLRLGAELVVAQGLKGVGEFRFRLGDDFNDEISFVLGANVLF